MEALRLRVKDLDFNYRVIRVINGKGGKDRVVTFPDQLVEQIKQQIEHARVLHNKDLLDGYGKTILPYALERKYPNASTSFHWQLVFPANKRSRHPQTKQVSRYHVHEQSVQRAIKRAVLAAGIEKPATCHSPSPFLRNSPARTWSRYSHSVRTIRPLRRQNNANLYPRSATRRQLCG